MATFRGYVFFIIILHALSAAVDMTSARPAGEVAAPPPVPTEPGWRREDVPVPTEPGWRREEDFVAPVPTEPGWRRAEDVVAP
ncbi:hypothetical protein FKP32DRAFT_1679962, partial [Trametes sanguinea]